MKKAFVWLMLLTVTALFAMSVTPALAHTDSDPLWKPLYAGSPHYYGEPGPKDPSWYFAHRTEVGGVRVWNDGDNLYVDYYTWVLGMDETHLAVAIEPSVDVNGDGEINILDADIPQTKSGNPKVGKFPYKYEGLGGAMIVMYTAYFVGNNWATFFTYTVQ